MARIETTWVEEAFALGTWPMFRFCATVDGKGGAILHTAFDLLLADFRSIHFLYDAWLRLLLQPDAPLAIAAPFAAWARAREHRSTGGQLARWNDHWRRRIEPLPQDHLWPWPIASRRRANVSASRAACEAGGVSSAGRVHLKDLGADSVDRVEIIVTSLARLRIEEPLSSFSQLANVDELVTFLSAKRPPEVP